MSYECCKSGFRWNGTPTGKETTIAGSKTYVSGSNKDVALLMIHDGFGWTLTNNRLLADHFASEANSTCYLPDFFGGEVIAPENIEDPEKRAKFDFPAFLGRNPKELRIKEITAVVKALKQEHGFKKVGAIGHCWGAWACFQLGAKDTLLIDAISVAHPSLLTHEEIDKVAVPTQIIAPETDPQLTPELKEYCNKVIPTTGIPYQYDYYPGVTHGFAVRCDMNDKLQRTSMERAKNSMVAWFVEHLQDIK